MKLAVIVDDSAHMVNTGAGLMTTYRTFDIPDDMAKFIRKAMGDAYVTVRIALEDQESE